MKLIYRHETCWILSLPAVGEWKLEFVYCPRHYRIAEHSHNQQDIELVLLFGHDVRFHRRKPGNLLGESFFAKFKHIGKVFSIPAGTLHWFEVSDFPLVFMNIEKWRCTPTSAAVDFNLYKVEKDIYAQKSS